MKTQSLVLFILVAALLAFTQACSTSRTVSDNKRATPVDRTIDESDTSQTDYKISPGDEIEILVWEQPSFNTLTTVSRLGTIAIPLVGEISVIGLTQDELKRQLQKQLKEYIKGDINLTVSVRNTDDLMVAVLGKVTSPGNYPIVDQTSIFRVLSSAGGPSEDANMTKVKLYRHSHTEEYQVLDLMEYLDSGQMNSETLLVRPGDIIYVPKQENVVREMSEFLRDVIILFGIFRVFN